MVKYVVTKRQCQKEIDSLGHVCGYCGGQLHPIRTTDNARNPTHWIGCFHGRDWGVFTHGVTKEIFDLAEKMVRDGNTIHSSSVGKEDREGWFQYQTNRFCDILRKAERLKTAKPRFTRKQFLKQKYF